MSGYYKRAIIAIALILASAATVTGQSPSQNLILEDGVPAHEGIDGLYQKFSEAYKTLDGSLIADIYAEHALYLSPGSNVKRGRDKIHKSFASSFEKTRERGETRMIAFRIVEREISGPLAYDVGIFTLIRTEADGTSAIDRGKFVVVARQQEDGSWQFQVDGYSDID